MLLAEINFLKTCLHVITVIACPLHVLGCYCILFKTPKTIGSVKWSLMNLHFWCMMLDWSITILTVPLLLFPALAGYPLGILTVLFKVPAVVQTYLVVTMCFGECKGSLYRRRFDQYIWS
ncbi:hypothetical protein GCK72_020947 [Caenorhabditis remanei]|uniref:Uncharacterized protein n=1 Tax=Caenorhabditis remanei TaxID=31234 RepID=A0A6A5GI74_CAERE|nr:hypothetical protein GCK72_020947 [Caenorhabditis remanei]KAF1754386.1 hypothetical protein GCK72_020947 [Caenorhabditis remanei]